MPQKRWRIQPHDPGRVADLARALRVPPLVAQLLIGRGWSEPARAREFLEAKLNSLREPGELPGAALAAQRLVAAVRDGRRIVVYGDYDVDGMSAAAILWQCLKLLGGDVGFYVPNRLDEGYGLNDEALRNLAQQGAKLIVTVDCGIASAAEAQTARQLGLELIITDHHEFGPALPEAAALVHPRLPGHAYPFGGLSGAGVALKVAWAACQEAGQAKKVGESMRSFLMQAVGLAALGAVADVVPLTDENRVLVRHGLVSLKQRPSVGLAALMKCTGLDKKPRLDAEDVAFTLGPRLNAAGRLGQAQLGVELLTTASPDRARDLAEYIDQLNGSRQSLERSILLAASKQVKEQFDPEHNSALVLAGRGWHVGVIGIVAGKLAEKHHRPVVMLALDELGARPAVGSARSIRGFDLHRALDACSHHLVGFGGHAAAAGLKIEERAIDDFRADLCEHAAGEIDRDMLLPELTIDGEAALASLTYEAVSQIDQLGPFGHGHPRPLFCTSDAELVEPPKRIGGGGHHLSLRLAQHGHKMRAVAFGGGDWADELAEVDGPLSLAFQPIINTFQGRNTVELQVIDWRVGSPQLVG